MRTIKALAIYDRPRWAIYNLWQAIAHGAKQAGIPLEVELAHVRDKPADIWQKAIAAHIVVLNWTGDTRYLRERLPRLFRLKIAQMLHSESYEQEPEQAIAQADSVAVASERVTQAHGVETDFIIPSAAGAKFQFTSTRSNPRTAKLQVGQFGSKANPGKNWELVREICAELECEFITDDEQRSPAQMARLYRSLDVYVCASRSEGSNVCIAEAIACGVPVITTRTGSAEFHVADGVNGWLIETDDADSLRKKLRWCLDNRAKLAEMGVASAARAREYTAADMARRAYDWLASMPPLVSVVIPCYDYAQYLPDAVESVKAQDARDWELLIVNDASPDNTRQVAAELARTDERIRVINLRKNRGLAGARNKGILEARGKYILPLDADDKLPAGALRAMAEEMLLGNRGDIVYGDIQVYGDQQELLRLPSYSVRELLHQNILPYNALFPRRAWQCAGGYKAQMSKAGGWEDYEFWLNLARRGYYGQRLERVTLEYRRHGRTMLHDAEENKPALRQLLHEFHGDFYAEVQAQAADVPVKYLGKVRRPFMVKGKITGRDYQFSRRHARQYVDTRDATALIMSGEYQQAKPRKRPPAGRVQRPQRRGG